ncbi:TonB-dependent receptor [Catenovulum sp. 2E275]|uniref:TonB-dependent receptor n=1 Tax=Catenovulum sp. 2E275 TaxID=2980497 RepID=UPI0021D07FC1|nr:TonB-dependent receptor [Catenovulum sp. 2E275]MCU4675242.1 TonB-dependent receptor [Catenovulum sp. 2E275]
MIKTKMSLAIMCALASAQTGYVFAQEVESNNQNASTETIQVKGIRQSLAKSISIKREKTGLVDAVVAEDIGKFPDANVAESLQRIPGVYLEREGASNEGNRITIRGLDSSYAVTTINGAPVHTTSGVNVGTSTRDFNYDVFPSELFGQVTVYKSSLAELTEGGIGGTVNLQTPRPFDGTGEEFSRYTINASYNDASEVVNPKGSFMYGNTWGNFGALVGLAYAKATNIRSGYETTGQYNTNALGRERAGTFRFEIDYDDPRADLGNLTQEEVDNAFLPRFHRVYASENNRERLSTVLSLQYKTDNLDISLDSLMAKLKDRRDEYTFGIAIRNSGQNGVPGIVPMDVWIDENNNLYGQFGNTTYFSTGYLYDSESDFANYNLRANYYINDDLSLRGQLTSSKSEAMIDHDLLINQADGVTSVIDASKSTVYPTLTYDRDFTDTSSWNLPTDLTFNQFKEEDKDEMALLELKWLYELDGWYGNIKSGVSQNISTKTSTGKNATTIGKAQIIANGKSFNEMSNEERLSFMDNDMPIDPYAKDAGSDFPKSWSTYSRDTILNVFKPKQAYKNADINYSSSFVAEEKVTSLFLQTDIQGEIYQRELKLNVGARYSKTEVMADNYTLDNGEYVPNTNYGEYSTFLPSLNASYDLSEDLVVRASIGKTITRVGLNLIAANLVIPDPFKNVATSGNPDLTPEASLSKDISLEWYFDDGGLLSIGAFWKNIKDQAVATSEIVSFESLKLPDTSLGAIFVDPDTGEIPPDLDITLNSYVNGAEQDLKGFEIAYQQNFTFLPEPFDKIGAMASYTNVDTKSANWVANSGKVFNIPTIPKYGYTLAGFYEDGPIGMRISYAYKSDKYVDPLNRGNDLNRVQAGVGYLDASFGYKLTDSLELRLEGSNLNNVLEYQYYPNPEGLYGDGKSRKNYAYYSGRTITLGIRGSF